MLPGAKLLNQDCTTPFKVAGKNWQYAASFTSWTYIYALYTPKYSSIFQVLQT